MAINVVVCFKHRLFGIKTGTKFAIPSAVRTCKHLNGIKTHTCMINFSTDFPFHFIATIFIISLISVF